MCHVIICHLCSFVIILSIFQGKTIITVRELIELSPLVVSYLVNKISNRVSPNFCQKVSEINVNCLGGLFEY